MMAVTLGVSSGTASDARAASAAGADTGDGDACVAATAVPATARLTPPCTSDTPVIC
jgi:hypothetical protein